MTLYFYSSSLLLGAPGVVEVVLSSLTGECRGTLALAGDVPVTVERVRTDRCKVKFQPKAADMYQGKHVLGSLLSVIFIPPLPDQVQQTGTMADHEALAEQVRSELWNFAQCINSLPPLKSS